MNKKLLLALLSTSLVLTACSTSNELKSKNIENETTSSVSSKVEVPNKSKDERTKKLVEFIENFDIEKLPKINKEKNKKPEAYTIYTEKRINFEEKINDYNDFKSDWDVESNRYTYSNALEGKVGTQQEKSGRVNDKDIYELIISNQDFSKEYNFVELYSNKKEPAKNEAISKNMNKTMQNLFFNTDIISDFYNIGPGYDDRNDNNAKLEITQENYKILLSPHFSEKEIEKIKGESIKGKFSMFADFDDQGNVYRIGYQIEFKSKDKDDLEYSGTYNFKFDRTEVSIESITEAEKF